MKSQRHRDTTTELEGQEQRDTATDKEPETQRHRDAETQRARGPQEIPSDGRDEVQLLLDAHVEHERVHLSRSDIVHSVPVSQ